MKSTSRALRILLATLGLSAAGAVFGGIAAAVAVVVWGAIISGGSTAGSLNAMGFAGVIGAMLGAFLGPMAAWGLLRRVPLGVAVLGATFGAFVGGSITAIFPAAHPLIGGAVGLIGGSVFLRYRYAKKAKAAGANALESGTEDSMLEVGSTPRSLE